MTLKIVCKIKEQQNGSFKINIGSTGASPRDMSPSADASVTHPPRPLQLFMAHGFVGFTSDHDGSRCKRAKGYQHEGFPSGPPPQY